MNKLTFLCRMYSARVKAPGAIGIERSQQFAVVIGDLLHIADQLGPLSLYDQVLSVYVAFRTNNQSGTNKLRFNKVDVANFEKVFAAMEHFVMNCVDGNTWRNFNKKHVWITNDTKSEQVVSLYRERAKHLPSSRYHAASGHA